MVQAIENPDQFVNTLVKKEMNNAAKAQLDKLEKFVKEYEAKVLIRAEDALKDAGTIIAATDTVMDTVKAAFDVIGQTPVVGGAFAMASKLLQIVQDARHVAEDVLETLSSLSPRGKGKEVVALALQARRRAASPDPTPLAAVPRTATTAGGFCRPRDGAGDEAGQWDWEADERHAGRGRLRSAEDAMRSQWVEATPTQHEALLGGAAEGAAPLGPL